mmetsp:Transcript_10321/g.21503  ORF Transcript_10321/g.21503 Transcript_10321/m.21503 type:complete len:211 (-) Transcript_10321:33-665(-)
MSMKSGATVSFSRLTPGKKSKTFTTRFPPTNSRPMKTKKPTIPTLTHRFPITILIRNSMCACRKYRFLRDRYSKPMKLMKRVIPTFTNPTPSTIACHQFPNEIIAACAGNPKRSPLSWSLRRIPTKKSTIPTFKNPAPTTPNPPLRLRQTRRRKSVIPTFTGTIQNTCRVTRTKTIRWRVPIRGEDTFRNHNILTFLHTTTCMTHAIPVF